MTTPSINTIEGEKGSNSSREPSRATCAATSKNAANDRLSKPQRDLLLCLPGAVSNTYRPAIKLVEAGLAEWHSSTFSDHLVITEAGRQALSESKP